MSGRGRNGGNNDYSERNERKAAVEARALAVIEPPRMAMPAIAAKEHGITETKWRALVDAVFPSAKTLGGVMLALDYCKARNLDPFKRVVHVVPMYNSKLGREVETVWPGIGELRTTAHRTGLFAGNDDCVFGRVLRQAFRESRTGQGNSGPYETTASCPEMDFPEWAQITVYKIVAGVRVPFVGPKVYFTETFSGEKGLRVPNARWRQAPRQMLEKCAEAAALRRAFPEELGDQFAAEEMEGKVVVGDGASAQAKYHYVNPEEADGGVTVEQGQQQSGGEQQQDQGDDEAQRAQREELATYINRMRGFFATVKTVKAIDNAMRIEAEYISRLPDAEREEAAQLEREARERLNAPRSDDQPETGDQQQDQTPPPADDNVRHEQVEDGDFTEEAEEEPAFVRNFRKRVEAVEFFVDLDKLVQTEKRAIDQRPGGEARACDAIVEAKRKALKGE